MVGFSVSSVLCRTPSVGTGIAAGCGDTQSWKEVGPAVRMAIELGLGQPRVHQIDPGTPLDRGERERNHRRAGRQVGAAFDTPRHDHPRWVLDVDEPASDRMASDIDGEAAARPDIQVGVLAHPRGHACICGQELKHRGRLSASISTEVAYSAMTPPVS